MSNQVKNLFNYRSILLLGIVFLVSCKTENNAILSKQLREPWEKLKQIEKAINEPFFRHANYNVIAYGAVADGKTFCTESFKKAILTCSKEGGGKVIVPKGIYLTGAIHLEDNVNLHLEEGAEIRFSTNPEDYPLVHTSFEGMELMNYSPLILSLIHI